MKLSKRGNSPRKILNYYAPDKRISQNKKKTRTGRRQIGPLLLVYIFLIVSIFFLAIGMPNRHKINMYKIDLESIINQLMLLTMKEFYILQ